MAKMSKAEKAIKAGIKTFIEAYDGKFKVLCEEYQGSVITKGYKGTLLKALSKAVNDHTGFFNYKEWVADGGDGTPETLLNEWFHWNGDGCDYVFHIETNGAFPVKFHMGVDIGECKYEDC